MPLSVLQEMHTAWRRNDQAEVQRKMTKFIGLLQFLDLAKDLVQKFRSLEKPVPRLSAQNPLLFGRINQRVVDVDYSVHNRVGLVEDAQPVLRLCQVEAGLLQVPQGVLNI